MDTESSTGALQIEAGLVHSQIIGDETVLALIVFRGKCSIGGGEEEVGIAFHRIDVILLSHFEADHAGEDCQHGEEEVEDDGML